MKEIQSGNQVRHHYSLLCHLKLGLRSFQVSSTGLPIYFIYGNPNFNQLVFLNPHVINSHIILIAISSLLPDHIILPLLYKDYCLVFVPEVPLVLFEIREVLKFQYRHLFLTPMSTGNTYQRTLLRCRHPYQQCISKCFGETNVFFFSYFNISKIRTLL